MSKSPDTFTFAVGKLDAGMAILLGERAHLIEFPSVLLPPGATAGSIVNIAVHRNLAEEKRRDHEFWDLQKEIYESFGLDTPRAPKLELRNVTQTSVTLEWPQLHLATAKLRSLDIYRNNVRLAAIPQPLHNTSTKLSGLELNSDYTFQLILRTTAGTYSSNVIRVRTHTMTDTSGISVCFGTVQDEALLEDAKHALRDMRAKWSDKIQIDTTHFVCTTPAAPSSAGGPLSNGPGVDYQRALQLSIPVVQPQWILACASERKMMPISQFYLGATPNTVHSSARPQSMSQVSLQRTPNRTSTTSPPSANAPNNRASMPPPRRSTNSNANTDPPDTSTFVNQNASSPPPSASRVRSPDRPSAAAGIVSQTVPEDVEAEGADEVEDDNDDGKTVTSPKSASSRRLRNGTMDRNFRFPSPTNEPPVPPLPGAVASPPDRSPEDKHSSSPSTAILEVPPPDPIEKERKQLENEAEDDIGATEEISLN